MKNPLMRDESIDSHLVRDRKYIQTVQDNFLLTFDASMPYAGLYDDARRNILLSSGIGGSQTYAPSFEEMVSLVYRAVQIAKGKRENNRLPDLQAEGIMSNLRNDGLFGFTRILWAEDGVYAYDGHGHILSKHNTQRVKQFSVDRVPLVGEMNVANLRDRLSSKESDGIIYSKDYSVRFAPKGYWRFKIGDADSVKIETNSVVRAIAGSQGAERLARIACDLGPKAYIHGILPSSGRTAHTIASVSDRPYGEWTHSLSINNNIPEWSDRYYTYAIHGIEKVKNGTTRSL